MRPHLLLIALSVLLALAACHDEERDAAVPAPQEISDTSVGQFCGMALTEHPGPKGQIFVRGQPKPFSFASVHDAVAFSMLPEMPKNLAAIYVTDMARAQDWGQPEAGTWIEARKALYVIGSNRKGGMDANEAVPFGDDEAARRFAAVNGGTIVRFAEIPRSYILEASTDGS